MNITFGKHLLTVKVSDKQIEYIWILHYDIKAL